MDTPEKLILDPVHDVLHYESQALDAMVESAMRYNDIRLEVRRLREIEKWALSTLHVKDGDKVVLARAPKNPGPGWVPYSEVLCEGRTGRVSGFYLNPNGVWCGLFTPDDCWVLVHRLPGETSRMRYAP